MRVSRILLAMCAAWCSLSTASRAGIVLSVDMDLGTAGIQATNTATVGDVFTAGLFLQTTAPSTLKGYNYSVKYDNGLQLTGRTESAFGPLTADFSTRNDINNVLGIAHFFDADDARPNPPGLLTPLGPVQIGTVTFTVNSAGNARIDVGRFAAFPLSSNFDFFLDAGLNVVPNAELTFNGGTLVTAVPEPTSAAMLGLGLIAVVLGRRRFSQNASKRLAVG